MQLSSELEVWIQNEPSAFCCSPSRGGSLRALGQSPKASELTRPPRRIHHGSTLVLRPSCSRNHSNSCAIRKRFEHFQSFSDVLIGHLNDLFGNSSNQWPLIRSWQQADRRVSGAILAEFQSLDFKHSQLPNRMHRP